jgi:hypothetical protein
MTHHIAQHEVYDLSHVPGQLVCGEWFTPLLEGKSINFRTAIDIVTVVPRDTELFQLPTVKGRSLREPSKR